MIIGAHVLLYSKDPDADRAFFHDVLQLHSVDAGGGWLIFALPPAEVAVHPADDDSGAHRLLHTQFYLMNRSSSRAAVTTLSWRMWRRHSCLQRRDSSRRSSIGRFRMYAPA